jgi:Outer membrane protein beta-barrel domain
MKNILIVIFVLLASTLSGQEVIDNSVNLNKRQIAIGLVLSPDYCFRTLKNNDGSSSSAMIIDLRNEMEEPVFGFTAGLNFFYGITEKVGIESGVHYSRQGFQLKKNDLFFGDPIDPRNGEVYESSGTEAPSSVKYIDNYNYLEIPLRAMFSFGEKRIRVSASGGITTDIFLNASETIILKYKDGEAKRTKQDSPFDSNTLNLTATFSIGAEYRLNSNFFFKAEPTFRYGLLEINDYPISAYLWRGGIAISCYYNLR